MTLFSMRAALALVLAASLASCGGGGSTAYPITGTVSGLMYDNLILTTGSQSVTINHTGVDANGVPLAVSYTFPKTLSYGDPFFVTLGANPPHQTCTVGQSAADSAGHMASISILVGCTDNPYTVSGYVTGLAVDGLQLINGSNSLPITLTVAGVAANAAAEVATPGTLTPSFTFPAQTFNQAYGVTVLVQPAGQTCTVANGTGILGDASITSVKVNCVTN